MADKKRLIYAEDLFEPVDFTVFQVGGRGGGKTMAMYEQLFRKRVELAPTIDAVEVVRCRECYFGKGELICSNPKCTKSFYGCPVPPEHYCSYGERKERQ